MLRGGLSRQYSNGPALNGGPWQRGQELAEAEGRKVHRCHSFKASFSIFGPGDSQNCGVAHKYAHTEHWFYHLMLRESVCDAKM